MPDLLTPLFPLEIVLFPGEMLPLHIFEERYKQMIAECLAKGETAPAEGEFGIVWAQDNKLHTLGCTAGVVQVLRRYEDGRLDILTVGRRRFEILLTNQDKPYLRGALAFFEDEDPQEAADSEVKRARGLFGEILRRLKMAEEDPSVPSSVAGGARSASFEIAARLPLGLEFKQQTLVMRNERERLHWVITVMEKLIAALEFREKARTKASGNGHEKSGLKPG